MTVLVQKTQKRSFAGRFRRALKLSCWSLTDAARHLGLPIALLRRWRDGVEQPMFADMVITLAHVLQVDARWLAIGRLSPSARRAIVGFRRARARGALLSNRNADRVEQLMIITPEPARGAFVCRYCGCTGEEWADDAGTICTACITGVPP